MAWCCAGAKGLALELLAYLFVVSLYLSVAAGVRQNGKDRLELSLLYAIDG